MGRAGLVAATLPENHAQNIQQEATAAAAAAAADECFFSLSCDVFMSKTEAGQVQ